MYQDRQDGPKKTCVDEGGIELWQRMLQGAGWVQAQADISSYSLYRLFSLSYFIYAFLSLYLFHSFFLFYTTTMQQPETKRRPCITFGSVWSCLFRSTIAASFAIIVWQRCDMLYERGSSTQRAIPPLSQIVHSTHSCRRK